jgi:hypothetical protein
VPSWPILSSEAWRNTYPTLHMWTQVAGKICLALTPRTNHFWNVTFQVTSRGLMTPLMSYRDQTLTMTFDFIAHQLVIHSSTGAIEELSLESRSVSEFYQLVMSMLRRMNVDVHIWTMPVEVPHPIRFEEDSVHHFYDRDAANAWWRTLVAIKPIFETFRSQFIGKVSPVHFFWGSFDLAVTRFSGRRAPERAGADAITRESYSHEVISHGFWPGGEAFPEPAFYAYSAPEPAGFRDAVIRPAAAFYSTDFSEFLLPYEAVRKAASPKTDLELFLGDTYAAAADLANWNRHELERR